MGRLLMVLPLVGLLAACEVTPLEQCQGQARRALNTNAEQIRQAELNIERGYQLVPAEVQARVGVQLCAPGGAITVCTGAQNQPQYRRVPVDRAAEQAKLAVLVERRAALEAEYAACAKRYPAG